MPEFPNQIKKTIEEFAKAMEMQLPITPASDGSYTFRFDQLGTLIFTPSSDSQGVVLSLGRRPPSADERFLEDFLRCGGTDPEFTNRFLHVGMGADGALYMSLRYMASEFDFPTLEAAVNRLGRQFDAL